VGEGILHGLARAVWDSQHQDDWRVEGNTVFFPAKEAASTRLDTDEVRLPNGEPAGWEAFERTSCDGALRAMLAHRPNPQLCSRAGSHHLGPSSSGVLGRSCVCVTPRSRPHPHFMRSSIATASPGPTARRGKGGKDAQGAELKLNW
jgi:hypothetical protein